MTPDDVLAALDPEQRAVATALDGPVCVLAGAGTGKTRAITHRIAYACLSGQQQPQHVLAVTFTTRAAGEMRQRLRRLGVPSAQARTFHSAALRQLQYFWPKVVGGALPRVIEHKAALIAEAATRLRLDASSVEIRDLAAEIEWAKVMQAAPDDYVDAASKARRPPPAAYDHAAVARLYLTYEDLKTARNVIDFEDVLLLTVGILDDQPDVAERVRGQYRHFVVDEFQDVSPLQHRLLSLWLGDRRSLCVVGDPSQTIYSFAGATSDYLVNFRHRYPDATVVRLIRDYRSTPQVVALANDLLRPARGRAGQQRMELIAQTPAGPSPQVIEYDDEVAEAGGVARRIASLLAEGVKASEIAVLFRTNAQSPAYEQALAEAGISYVVRGGERFFQRREVREAITLLRGAARAAVVDEAELVDQVRGVLGTMGFRPEPPPTTGSTRDRWESLASIVQLAEDFSAGRASATLTQFVAELDQRAAAQHAPTADAVVLASLHAAKGLEWDAVFLVGLVDGLLPISYAATPDAVEEERRLLYVGVTRARRHLELSWSLARSPGSRGNRQPSPFLDPLQGSHGGRGQAVRNASRRSSPVRSVAQCRTCGKPLIEAADRKIGRCAGCPAEYDEDLYDRLRAWRMAEATAQKVPAYCIFTDATLVAIAESRPRSAAALARVPGVGSVKLERYAGAVLEICSAGG